MSAAENKRSVTVGIFVLLAILIFVATVFVLGGQQKRFVKTIRVTTVLDDVTGLKLGNNVIFSGVKVGVVKQISFKGTAQVEIAMSIEDEARKYIHKDTQAKVGSESLIGNKSIILFGGSPNAPVIEEGDRLKAAYALSTDTIMATLQENNKNLVAITSDFKTLSSQLVQGKGTVGALLQDSAMAMNFRAIAANLERTSAITVNASRALAQFSQTLNNKEGLANSLLTDTVMFNRLNTAMGQLEQATATANEITNNLNKVSGKLNQSNNTVDVLLNDPEFAQHLRKTMENLESSTLKLDENMESLQHSILLNGFFRRRAKKQAKDQEKAAKEAQKDSIKTGKDND